MTTEKIHDEITELRSEIINLHCAIQNAFTGGGPTHPRTFLAVIEDAGNEIAQLKREIAELKDRIERKDSPCWPKFDPQIYHQPASEKLTKAVLGMKSERDRWELCAREREPCDCVYGENRHDGPITICHRCKRIKELREPIHTECTLNCTCQHIRTPSGAVHVELCAKCREEGRV